MSKPSNSLRLLCSSKMAEEPHQRKADLPPASSARLPPGPEDSFGTHSQKSMPSYLTKEELYKQQQKCELRRLLKHTHPELKKLDKVVDEELAEVLGAEFGGTAGETGYEGEVLSRRLLFENCALSNRVSPCSHKMHMAEWTVGSGDVNKTPAVPEEHGENKSVQGIDQDGEMLGSSQENMKEGEEEMTRIDVQATRRKFENPSAVNTSILKPDKKYQSKVSISGDETRPLQKQEQQLACSKRDDLEDQIHPQVQTSHIRGQSHQPSGMEQFSYDENTFDDEQTSPPDPEKFDEIIKTSAALFQNNPFIPTNIERENLHTDTTKFQRVAEDSTEALKYPIANVKNRTHVFESLPFHQIRHQNQDEIETMVENIKETLSSLYHVDVIHSGGSIIEVNETMLAKKAKFTVSEEGPEIKYDEVGEGGAQNFILQLLPRANLKPQITYLKENSNGSMEVTAVKVPLHKGHYTTHQDTEFKTANVVQVVEDILNQDNSLRKGVIFQEDVKGSAEVFVYSLYKFFDKDDVKRYCPPQATDGDNQELEREDVGRVDNQEPQRSFVKSAIKGLLGNSDDLSCGGLTRPDVVVKGNVKLFKSCIEKGDLEYLKSLQDEPAQEDQEVPSNQNLAGQTETEFHHEQRDDQEEEGTSEWVPVDVKKLKNMFSKDGGPVQPKQNRYLYENSTKSVCSTITGHHVSHGKDQFPLKCNTRVPPHDQVKEPYDLPQGSSVLLKAQGGDMVHQAELVEVVDDNDEITDLQAAIHSLQVATIEAKSLHQSSQEKQKFLDQGSSKEVVISAEKSEPPGLQNYCSETSAPQQDGEEVVFEGKLKAALDSLGRSNINVTQGDFRAAMIYRRSSKPHKGQPQSGDGESVQKTNKKFLSPVTDPEPIQEPVKQDVTKRQVTTENLEPLSQNETPTDPSLSAGSEKSRKPTSHKPVIPPKPEHLRKKPRDIQFANTEIPETVESNSIQPIATASQPLVFTSVSTKQDHQQSQIKTSDDENSGLPSEGRLGNEVNSVIQQQETNTTSPQDVSHKDNMGETDESHVDFHKACQKFESKKAITVKSAPVKPKRVKIAQSGNKNAQLISRNDNSSVNIHTVKEPQKNIIDPQQSSLNACGQAADSKDKYGNDQENKVEIREKRGRTETEDQRRQRLSVHMDEIMRGNISTAMEIFDNLRKQEELKCILSRVEEIEEDTSGVDVASLRGVFENVPDWVVHSDKKKKQKENVEHKEERLLPSRDNTDGKSSVAHVFGDLERASEEIMNLKEQTLSRLMDIEETIKKALYSVSTLKSDSDIAGLSSLFKESMGAVQGSPSSGNIRKISIGSSRKESQPTKSSPAALRNTAQQDDQLSGVASSSKRVSPPTSPAYISIQSAARKTDKEDGPPQGATICPACQHSPVTKGKYRTTKTLKCNSPAQNRKKDPRKGGQKQSSQDKRNPKQELSVVDVQAASEGILGTKTVTENYERTDSLGNRFYSSKTSTVVTTQPETTTTSGLTVDTPATYQVTTYPEVLLPINQKR
ncbi:xin actin-binding repeat-containing protein 1-like [Halichoeres trimaculatus]|uniref:xin actin-binding repeat-containing protein 1-like n=1 Tax=Halichoeres trimaculatus TaxID=147232 RepID=UPI003D9E62F2